MKKFAIIVAGGHGSRMGSELPKQFMLVAGKPILQHTLEKFFGIADEIIVVLPASHFDHWQSLKDTFDTVVPHQIAAGGATRTESVKNGLALLGKQEGIVAIHDAVRPLVSASLISAAFSAAQQHNNAIPVVSVKDTLFQIKNASATPVDRNAFRAVQTPQCFDLSLLCSAYDKAGNSAYTDDATVFHQAGNKLHLIPGEEQNIKITYKEDLIFASGRL